MSLRETKLQELSGLASRVVLALETQARGGNIRADEHETLMLEADVIRARLRHLAEGLVPPMFLQRSCLLGTALAVRLSRLAVQVRDFHELCDREDSASSGRG